MTYGALVDPNFATIQLCEHSQRLLCAHFMVVLQLRVQEILDGAVETLVAVLLVTILDVHYNVLEQQLNHTQANTQPT
jgi:hypothetical protein